MPAKKPFSKDIILLENVGETVENIIEQLREDILHRFKRHGAVVGISGGIDSSVCLALDPKHLALIRCLGLCFLKKTPAVRVKFLPVNWPPVSE